ncbi:MAG TPA: hypothetical protein VGV86_17340 [Acidimicrobiales bacterium]|nr:hypothetical protein [Acidimicrobiales bacterium]
MRAASQERTVAVVGALGVLGGGVVASVAQRAGPTADFVSILGVPGRRMAWAFRAGQGVAAAASIRLGGAAVIAAATRGRSATTGDGRRRWRDVVRSEPRGAAALAAGCLLALLAAVPCSEACPIPLVEGTGMALRDWVHVPAAVACFYLWPVAAHGTARRLLVANLVVLSPFTLTDPHGSANAVLQRTMVTLAAAALVCWQPTGPASAPALETATCRLDGRSP